MPKEQLPTPIKELPFQHCKVFYSGSMKGAPEADASLPMKLVKYMKDNGAQVLSEHVAIQDKKESDKKNAENSGISYKQFRGMSEVERQRFVRATDLRWVHEATHLVALVNAPSHGVGIEIQEAIRTPRPGFNSTPTPILCLIQEENRNRLSYMISGITKNEAPNFHLRSYKNEAEACLIIGRFLTGKLADN